VLWQTYCHCGAIGKLTGALQITSYLYHISFTSHTHPTISLLYLSFALTPVFYFDEKKRELHGTFLEEQRVALFVFGFFSSLMMIMMKS